MSTIARYVIDILIAGVWQDAGIALIALVVLALAGTRLSAATRAFALQCLLVTMVLAPVLTTVPKLVPQTTPDVTLTMTASHTETAPKNVMSELAPPSPQIRVVWSAGIVLACAGFWLLGVTLYGLRLLKSAVNVARLERRCTPLDWRGHVQLLSSSDIAVPFAFGLLHPRIMLPQELAKRDGEEFDCIVLHELAHVRRHDAWLNAFERIIQALLYFNPAIVIVLRAIAIEREAACDDWAIHQSRDLDAYVRSLASFALRCTQTRTLAACGVTSFGHATLTRLRRLDDSRRNRTVSLSTFALGGFAFMLLFIALSLQWFAPSIALANEPSQIALATDPCPKRPALHVHLPESTPRGLRTDVVVMVSSARSVGEANIARSSGNAKFDKLASDYVVDFFAAVGQIAPPDCKGVKPGLYRASLQSAVSTKNLKARFVLRVDADGMKHPVVLTPAATPM